MRFSVIVPAYNEEKTISECLKSIQKQTFKGFECIAVCGGQDKTETIARRQCITLKDTRNAGAGAARNLGAANARGEILIFTDADTNVPKNWLEAYDKAFQDADIVAAGGPVRPRDGGLADKILFFINQDLWYRTTALLGFYQFSGQNSAYRKKTFPGFDEDLSMMEDTELANRVKGKKVFVPVPVKSSARRFRERGYASTLLQYLKAYADHYVLRKPVRAQYFKSAAQTRKLPRKKKQRAR
ncbi:MAG: glycosyltransferase [Candidatus Diapherotrites archaeon]|nr:glycosyltransferase [Candidatus Diapherotrites archaeon]